MATVQEATVPVIGQKRGPGRPPKSGLLPNKKVKRDAPIDNVSSPSRPSTPNGDKRRGLSLRLQETRPLPTTPEPQSLDLPDAEYASIASSGILARSIEQSRVSWTQNGVFERFWTKPETGKNAKPPPPNNPDIKSMKSRGRCRLRIEPHIFEVEVWVVERPRPQPPKQYLPPKPQVPQWQMQQPHMQETASANSSGEEKESGSNPVINLLAVRAANDPELKSLMKEVAAGQAQPEQLKVFQKHIDELNEQLQAQRAAQVRPAQPAIVPQPFTQQPYTPPLPPSPGEVVFAFTTPGATSDRFLFPQHCILEALTPQHILASFVITRKGAAATNPADIDVDKEYWSPVTIMVEVAYGREGILKELQRWVKPGDESRQYMAKVMSELERIPETHLMWRVPIKGSAAAESSATSKVGTPVPQVIDSVKKRKSVKDVPLAKKRGSLGKGSLLSNAIHASESDAITGSEQTGAVQSPAVETPNAVDPNARPTRSTRRSARYSDV